MGDGRWVAGAGGGCGSGGVGTGSAAEGGVAAWAGSDWVVDRPAERGQVVAALTCRSTRCHHPMPPEVTGQQPRQRRDYGTVSPVHRGHET